MCKAVPLCVDVLSLAGQWVSSLVSAPVTHSMSPSTHHPHHADDDSSSSSSEHRSKRVLPRSATVSPSAHSSSFRHNPARRRSDLNLSAGGIPPLNHRRPPSGRRSGTRERSEGRLSGDGLRLRKTNSEPSVEIGGQEVTLDAIRQLLESLPKLARMGSVVERRVKTASLKVESSDSSDEEEEEDEAYAGIEELRDAAKSIQSLQRVLTKGAVEGRSSLLTPSHSDEEVVAAADSTEGGRVSGISTRLGSQPRGVMQFLPSIRQGTFHTGEDTYRNRRPLTRKTSAPENYLSLSQVYARPPELTSPRRRAVCDELYGSTGHLCVSLSGGGDGSGGETSSLAGVSRFSRLLASLGRDGEEQETAPSISWTPLTYSECTADARTETPLLEADVLLWKKRSRASLRRHSSVRNLAARELYDTEKSFVDCLEYLVQKYMRPLRQPLECTLIEAGLVDKIFYKIPEILAHHQVLLAALSTRIESWHKDTVIGDVLLAHFSKQSMVDTYMSFVDNFPHAKSAVSQARTKPSFEKYYNRCCRDHHNKLDLDSMLISPIQRVPRYELIIKQLLQHTPVYHGDHERLLRAQKHVHHLACSINRHRQLTDQMEQRLREIEAIVDGLEDLVSAGRCFVRYDTVGVRGREGKRSRCVFTFTDQLILTSVKRRIPTRNGKIGVPPAADYLDCNRFQLLIKIAIQDIDIAKDTLAVLRETESAIEEVKEDVRVLKKMSELAALLRGKRDGLLEVLSDMETDNSQRLRSLSDQLTSNPDLTTVVLSITTRNGVETVPLEFGSAEKRAVWESALRGAKTALFSQNADTSQFQLKSVVAHQTRPGLEFRAATVVPGKRADSPPSVWACTADRFQGQVAVLSLEGGEPTIESCAGIGNSAVVAVATVPPPSKIFSHKRKAARAGRLSIKDELIVDLPSSCASSDSSDEESSLAASAGTTTIWVGNEDGEIFVLGSSERVRSRCRERVARIGLPVDAIATSCNSVFVSASRDAHIKLLVFRPTQEGGWDLEHPSTVPLEVSSPIRTMAAAPRRLFLVSGHRLLLLNPTTHVLEKWVNLLAPPSSLSSASSTMPSQTALPSLLCNLCLADSLLFLAAATTAVHVVDSFSLLRLNEFSIGSSIQTQLAGRDDILREHKMGCLRVTSLATAKSLLWVGTSAGIVIYTPLSLARSQQSPPFTVCSIGHAGVCRLLLPIPLTHIRRKGRSSISVNSLHASKMLLLSCGEGLDDLKGGTQDVAADSVNHLIFWKSN